MNVTDPINGSYYIHNQLSRTDMGTYTFTFQVEHHQFWRPFNITISVNNSVGSSPFSDHVIIRGARNGTVINIITQQGRACLITYIHMMLVCECIYIYQANPNLLCYNKYISHPFKDRFRHKPH